MNRIRTHFLAITLAVSSFFAVFPAFAQISGTAPTTARVSRNLELQQVRESLEATAKRQKELREEIGVISNDVGAINRALITATARGHQLELQVTDAEDNLSALLKAQNTIQDSVDQKRSVLAEVLGALQRMGSNPPPALLVKPQDALSSVRSAILLGAVVPAIKNETDEILRQLRALRESTNHVALQKRVLANRLNSLAEDEMRLTLLVEEKNKLAMKSRSDLQSERFRAGELAQKAKSLEELILSLESEIASAVAATEAARVADEKRKLEEKKRLKRAQERLALTNGSDVASTTSDRPSKSDQKTVDIGPSVAFSSAKGTLPKPVGGVVLYGFGDKIGPQSHSSGMAFATRPNGRVRAPYDSRVVYAGPFRSYGQILILNAGQGYHFVLSGLSEVNVEPGRFVLAGEPVGRMGIKRTVSTVAVDLGSNRPVLTVELRKDGKPVDPAPWWEPDRAPTNETSSIGSMQKGSNNDS